jgi:creatinine amidohydrolase
MADLESLSASELRTLISSGTTTAVVPFGSIEHQGAHLPLGADALVADFVGREVATRLDALLAPAFRVGCAAGHAALAGTLSLRAETVSDLACGVAHGLVRDGVRVIAFMSTHGGNFKPLQAAAASLSETLDECVVCAPRGDLGPSPGAHSGEWLTSVMLALRPDLVHVERAAAQLAGEVGKASAARGHEHLERFVASVVAQVPAASR